MFSWFSGPSSSEYQSVRSTSSSESSSDEVDIRIEPAAAGSGTGSGPASAVSQSFAKVKGFLGIAPEKPPEEKTFSDEFDEMMSMTRTQRMYGFAITFVLGWVLSLMSLFAVPQIVLNPEKFALLYTVGNIVSLCSTAFLWGPCQQIKDMFKPIRVVATVLYLLSMALTLFCAFKLRMMLPTIIAIVIQMCAMVWYCLSYIPYGHDMLKSCMGTCCSTLWG